MAKHYMRKIVEEPLNLIDIDKLKEVEQWFENQQTCKSRCCESKLKDLRKQQSKIKDIIHQVNLSMPAIYYLNRRFKHDS